MDIAWDIYKKIIFKLKFKFSINKMMRKNDYKFKSNNVRYFKYFIIKNMF